MEFRWKWPILNLAALWLFVTNGIGYDSEFCSREPLDILKEPIRIGAWNIQRLGKTKMSKHDVVEALIAIIQRYDIMVVQEVVDSTGEAQQNLLDRLNDHVYFTESNIDPEDMLKHPAEEEYSMVQSKRLGSGRAKEQYVFYYRRNKVHPLISYQYPDKNDTFRVDPFTVIFSSPNTDIETFGVMAIHTSPSRAVREIDALVDAYDEAMNETGIADVIIIGDFNAGCTYVRGDDWNDIRLRHDRRFQWLISDHVDTTTKSTTCPYDRVVISGPMLDASIYEHSAKAFYFKDYLNISDSEFLLDISDHYPVEILLKGKMDSKIEKELRTKVGVSVEVNSTSSTISEFRAALKTYVLFEKDPLLMDKAVNAFPISIDGNETWHVFQITIDHPEVLHVVLAAESLMETVQILESLSKEYPCLFTVTSVEVLIYKLNHNVLLDGSLYGEDMDSSSLQITLLCLPSHLCTITVEAETTVFGI